MSSFGFKSSTERAARITDSWTKQRSPETVRTRPPLIIALIAAFIVFALARWPATWPGLSCVFKSIVSTRDVSKHCDSLRLTISELLEKHPWFDGADPIAKRHDDLARRFRGIGATSDGRAELELEDLLSHVARLMLESSAAGRAAESRARLVRGLDALPKRLSILGDCDPKFSRLLRDRDEARKAWNAGEWEPCEKFSGLASDEFHNWLKRNGTFDEINTIHRAEDAAAALKDEIQLQRREISRLESAGKLLNTQIHGLGEQLRKLTDAYTSAATNISVALVGRSEAENRAADLTRALERACAARAELETTIAEALQKAESNRLLLGANKQQLQIARDKLDRTCQEAREAREQCDKTTSDLSEARSELAIRDNELRALAGDLAVKEQQLESALEKLADSYAIRPSVPLPPVEVRLPDRAPAAASPLANQLLQDVTAFLQEFNRGRVPQAGLIAADGVRLQAASSRLCRAIGANANAAELSTEFGAVQRAWERLRRRNFVIAIQNGINPSDPRRPNLRRVNDMGATLEKLGRLLSQASSSALPASNGYPSHERDWYIGRGPLVSGTTNVGQVFPPTPQEPRPASWR
jgi:hypothetical protein